MRKLLKPLALLVVYLLEHAFDFKTSPLPQIAERLKMLFGRYEIGTTRFITKNLHGGVAFDIGANVGYYARLMEGKAERVYAFEPDPENYKILEANCRKHPNVTPVNMAVGDLVGEVDFFIVPGSAMRHSLIDEGNTTKITVPCTTLDAFIEKNHLRGISLIKIDVEGAEQKVFEGMQRLLSVERPVIIYEGYDPKGRAIADSGELVPAPEAPKVGSKQQVTNMVL